MPFIRHLRDKRGYETTLVLHGYRPAQGPQRTRVLYLFRAPTHLKLGRRALDEEAREALEHTHPDVSFDWNALNRESAAMRQVEEPRDRERDRDRERRAHRAAPVPPRPAPPVRTPVEDDSVLGRVVGAEGAAKLRALHAELLQRITRRARAPEERDRLTEAALRLNPDSWPDEATIQLMVGTVEASRDTILQELPARRRGRRGGRRRERGEGENPSTSEAVDGSEETDQPEVASDIMTGDGEHNASQESGQMARHDPDAGGVVVDGRPGPEPAEPATGYRLSRDDQFRPD